MRALLVLQEGPGSGHSYPLDPFKQAGFSVGRSSQCDIVLSDHRASRHHGDIRWNGRHWEVIDRGSTNGTYVNGMQVHRPYELRPGDRVTIGETTMVLREFEGTVAGQPVQSPQRQIVQGLPVAERPKPAAHQPEGRVLAAEESLRATATPTPAFWLVQGLIVMAVICLSAGAFLPWLRVTGSMSQDLEPLIQGIANLVASLSGNESMFSISQQIGGLEGYGKLTLGIAIVALIVLLVDVFFYQKSFVPGIVYLVSGLVAAGAIGFDLVNYARFYNQVKELSLVFGIQLADIVQVLDHLIEVQVTPMIGLPLTGAGLVLLLAGGIGRAIVAFVERGK